MDAYILIQTRMGTLREVIEQVARVLGVVSAAPVTGPFDAVVRARGASQGSLDRETLSPIQRIDGVIRTLTCPIWGRAGRPFVPAGAGAWSS